MIAAPIAHLGLAQPSWLWLLAAVAAIAVAYLVQQWRRRSYSVRFATLPMLDRLVPRRPRWRRHLPAALLLATFVVLTIAAARPEVDEEVPRERATVMLVVDVSLSMEATDVEPSRISAAREAAASFVEGLPDGFNVGVVTFSGAVTVLAQPSPDHDEAIAALDDLQLDEGTAIADGVITALQQIDALARSEGEEDVPAHVVLLSDGTNTVGSPLENAVERSAEADVPISTIAYGTEDGTVVVDGQLIPVPVDVEALAQFAADTGGEAYEAETADQLNEVYEDIQSSIGYRIEQVDATGRFLVGGLILGMIAAAFSLLWFSRIP